MTTPLHLAAQFGHSNVRHFNIIQGSPEYRQKVKGQKVSTLDIRIKKSGLQVSHSKVPSSEVKTCVLDSTNLYNTLSRNLICIVATDKGLNSNLK